MEAIEFYLFSLKIPLRIVSRPISQYKPKYDVIQKSLLVGVPEEPQSGPDQPGDRFRKFLGHCRP